MTDTRLTTEDLAQMFRCDRRTIREKATALGLGVALGGRAGYRYSQADVDALTEALRPTAPVARRRRRAS